MNGAPLPLANGFPARLVVPGWTATYWVKALADLQVTDKAFDGFWMKTAYRVPKGMFGMSGFESQDTEQNSPITSIKGYSDMLGKGMFGELNEAQQQFVDTIRSNVTRMEHLVTDISDISKIHAGRLRLEPKMDMYKNVAMEVEKNTRDLATQHEHTLTFDTPSGLPILNLDSTRLAQVLTKLVINALQYTSNGGTITVKAERVNGSLKVSVIDTGIGMTGEEQTHIGGFSGGRTANWCARSGHSQACRLPSANQAAGQRVF
jgi:light-regulated signal transduction histidine kinase (bacteriophytochrome)